MIQFDFEKTYTLEDERVLLRPLQASDLPALIPFAVQEPDIWRYSLVSAAGEQGMARYIDLALAGKQARQEYPFIVFDKQAQRYVGCSRFYDIQLEHQTLQLGYTWYGKSFQGTGLNSHCKFLMLQFAFEQMDMLRVEFRADTRNARSINAMKGIGCTVEGFLRNHLLRHDGERRTSIVLSILQEEWQKNVKQNLARRCKNLHK
ncbi:MAG: N-acetyltransferase [Bacteroidetes bacterium]|nr:MAG: N-acetyltransferase [Bacteroidota bacterium]